MGERGNPVELDGGFTNYGSVIRLWYSGFGDVGWGFRDLGLGLDVCQLKKCQQPHKLAPPSRRGKRERSLLTTYWSEST